MKNMDQQLLQIPHSVRKDTAHYRTKLDDYLNGHTSEIAFKAYRVPMGVYAQRGTGRYMARIRIAAGLAAPEQLRKIAGLSEQYGNSNVHVTTRQDLQLHDLAIEDTAAVLEDLLEVGLSTRGGGGNTVRNITACPRAGICPQENFDVAPHAIALAEYLLQSRDSFNLPRKYKIVFSGCHQDCALASVADLGFFAHTQEGKKGFAVFGAGGLGSNPATAIKLEDFVAEDDIFAVAQSIKNLFDQHGDRSNKHRARLRYVVRRLGEEAFLNIYRQKRKEVDNDGLKGEVPAIRRGKETAGLQLDASPSTPEDHSLELLPEKKVGLFTIKLHLHLGDIPAGDLRKVADIAQKHSRGYVRTTQLQNLLITSAPADQLNPIDEKLNGLSIDVRPDSMGNIVACAGAATCKLGLCLSQGLATAIGEKFRDMDIKPELPLRISGCPNSCANHCIGAVGFQGRAKRVDDRLMPCYDILAGGAAGEGKARLAERIGTVPAKAVPDLLAEAFQTGKPDPDILSKIVERKGDFSADTPADYFYDYGTNEPFSLAGRGPGECGAGVMDVIEVDIDAARDALEIGKSEKKHENLYEAILSASRALLIIYGEEPQKDREVFESFRRHLLSNGWVTPETGDLLDAAVDWRMGDRDSLTDVEKDVENLVARIGELFRSLNAELKFGVEPFEESSAPGPDVENSDRTADLRGVACPMNFVKAKLELEKIEVGETLEVLLDNGEPVKNVPESFAGQGQEVLEIAEKNDHFSVRIKRLK